LIKCQQALQTGNKTNCCGDMAKPTFSMCGRLRLHINFTVTLTSDLAFKVAVNVVVRRCHAI